MHLSKVLAVLGVVLGLLMGSELDGVLADRAEELGVQHVAPHTQGNTDSAYLVPVRVSELLVTKTCDTLTEITEG